MAKNIRDTKIASKKRSKCGKEENGTTGKTKGAKSRCCFDFCVQASKTIIQVGVCAV
jgi:hypothetical protein